MWSDQHGAALAAVFEALNQSEIKWMVLRNYEGLPLQNRSKDVDLAVGKSDWPYVRAVIGNVMKAHGFDRVFVESFQYAECNTYVCLDGERVVSLKIDLLEGFNWRGACIFSFNELYGRCITYGDLKVPSHQDDGFMLWVKPLLTGGFVKDRYGPDILQCFRDDPSTFCSNLDRIFGKRMSRRIRPLFEQGELQATVLHQGQLRRAAWIRAVSLHPWATACSLIGHVRIEGLRRVWRTRGSMFAVVGPDGVGKTTFLKGFCEELARIRVKDAGTVTVRHFRPHMLPNLNRLFSGRSHEPTLEEFSRPHRATPAGTFSSIFRLSYYWLDYLFGYLLRVRPQCIRHRVVVFDRYCYDFVVDPRRSRLGLPLWVRRLFLRLTPQPDLVFFLDCDPDTVYARKQELERNEISRQLEAYRELARREPGRFVRLDSSRTPESSCTTAVGILVDRLSAPL